MSDSAPLKPGALIRFATQMSSTSYGVISAGQKKLHKITRSFIESRWQQQSLSNTAQSCPIRTSKE